MQKWQVVKEKHLKQRTVGKELLYYLCLNWMMNAKSLKNISD